MKILQFGLQTVIEDLILDRFVIGFRIIISQKKGHIVVFADTSSRLIAIEITDC